jgi:hypothetical protein
MDFGLPHEWWARVETLAGLRIEGDKLSKSMSLGDFISRGDVARFGGLCDGTGMELWGFDREMGILIFIFWVGVVAQLV